MNIIDKIKNGVYIIAEMSANHGGNIETALKIVHAAKEAGADCLKIQTYTPDSMTIDCDNEHFRIKSGLWAGYNLYQLYTEAATSYEWQPIIKNECDRIGIDFLSTPFDTRGVDFLEEIGVSAYKIASFELIDIPLIRHVARKGKPVIISTGMAEISEIQDAVDTMFSNGLSREQIILMKCTSEYPALTEDMNLATISDMAKRFGVAIGFSDHTIGTLAPIVAVALGARVIEKHLTLSRNMDGPDSKFSTEPQEFTNMVRSVRDTMIVCGDIFYGATSGEKENSRFRRSIFAVRDIEVGEMFSEDNIRVIRPGCGLSPKHYVWLIGKKSANAYRKGEPIMADANE